MNKLFLILQKHNDDSNAFFDPTYGDTFPTFESAKAYAQAEFEEDCMIVEFKAFV